MQLCTDAVSAHRHFAMGSEAELVPNEHNLNMSRLRPRSSTSRGAVVDARDRFQGKDTSCFDIDSRTSNGS